ncbi:MAG: hypothetical protein H0U57_12420 [Tatlockia sp.]|nr:hypothetical protein [Tatlockia sp.]
MSKLKKYVLNNLGGEALVDLLTKNLNQYNNIEDKKDSKAQELSEVINQEFNEVMRRLSSDDIELREGVESSLSSNLKDDEKAMDQIQQGVLNRYKNVYERLLKATDIFIQKVAEDFSGKRATGVSDTGAVFNAHSVLPGGEELTRAMKEGTANQLLVGKIPSMDYSIYHPTIQAIGLSKINKSLLSNNYPLPKSAKWQEYRAKTINTVNAVKELTSPLPYKDENGVEKTTSILDEMMKESSPVSRSFFDVINDICDTLGLGRPIGKSKVQEFRDSFKEITKHGQIENPLEQDLISRPELK